VHFSDIGEQQVKNIPTPVHAYHVEMRPDEMRSGAAPAAKPVAPARAGWVLPVAIVAPVVALVVGGAAVYFGMRPNAPPQPSQPVAAAAVPAPTAQAAAPPQQAVRQAEALVPEAIPLVGDRARVVIRNEYLSAADHKALAISSGPIGFITGQADDETARSAALDICQKRADALPLPRKCELYAVGNAVVYARGRPPMPSPLFKNDASVLRPLVAAAVPLVPEQGQANIEKTYRPGRTAKALALGPRGGFYFVLNQDSPDEAIRRALELCGTNASVPCLLLAVNDNFVVPIPATMKVTGFFQPAAAGAIAPEQRADVERRVADGNGWTAVAAGSGNHAGVATGAANEQDATAGALADCAKRDSACRVIAIGPFAVEAR
jgi:hypothetical protein